MRNRFRFLFVPVLLSTLTILLVIPSQGLADFPNEAELRTSRWKSTYTVPGGGSVHAQIRFNGSGGTYVTRSFTGQFSDVTYRIDTSTNPAKPFFQIDGKWSAQGQQGDFLFTSKGADRFEGSWRSNQGASGRWSGRRVK